MNRIQGVFHAARERGRIAFIPYVVAGYPDVETSIDLATTAIDAGADLLEIGLPFSDPLADGVTLQRATAAALAAGASFEDSLRVVERVCLARPETPVLVMGYANQFMGPRDTDAVAARLAEVGASGAIVADLPPEEGEPLEAAFDKQGLELVYLVAPTTPDERVTFIAERAGGFVYCVSLTGVTGARSAGPQNLEGYVARVKRNSQLPVAIGFGVSRPEHLRAVAASGADGAIVASALVDALGADGRDIEAFKELCAALAAATAAASPPA